MNQFARDPKEKLAQEETPAAPKTLSQCLEYDNEIWKISESVHDIMTDRSGTVLYNADKIKQGDVIKLINLKTKEEIKITGQQLINGFRSGIISLIGGVMKVVATKKDKRKKSFLAKSKKGWIKDEKRAEKKNILERMGLEFSATKVCPYCGEELVLKIIEDEEDEESKTEKKGAYIKCAVCRQKVFLKDHFLNL